MISFPSFGIVDIGSSLPDNVESLITGIIGEGVAAYPHSELGWIGSLSDLKGGDGYWFNASEDCSFSFDLNWCF